MPETRRALLFHVARLYYEQQKTQAEIGRLIHTSRPSVSRILKEARDTGVVNITLNYPWERDIPLEKEFVNHFNLKDARILKSYDQNNDQIIKGLGFFAAEYIDNTIQEGDVITCSYGRTVASTIQALNPNRKLKITVVQMIGALGVENPFIDGPDLVRFLSQKYGGEYRYLLAPLVVQDSATRQALVSQIRFQQTMELAKSAKIAVSGIGSMEEDLPSLIWTNYIHNEKWKALHDKGAVGHFSAFFLEEDGNLLDDEINQRVISMDLESLKRIPYMIAVAGGKLKARAILSALKGGYPNILVTDDSAANKVLDLIH